MDGYAEGHFGGEYGEFDGVFFTVGVAWLDIAEKAEKVRNDELGVRYVVTAQHCL